MEEFDRVVGGGIVLGSVNLIGGEPGIGKSTLLLQCAARLEAAGVSTLYASGEESPNAARPVILPSCRAGRKPKALVTAE